VEALSLRLEAPAATASETAPNAESAEPSTKPTTA